MDVYKEYFPVYYPRGAPMVDFTFKETDIEDLNYIPIPFLNERLSLLKHCKKLSFKGNLLVTDAIFWKLSAFLNDPNENYPLLDLNCSACVHLTDGAGLCISLTFRNLEAVSFDGCEKITERSVVALTLRCTRLKSASFVSCNVKLLPQNIFNQTNIFDFKGCPVTFLKSSIKEKAAGTKQYKIVIVRDDSGNTLIGKSDTKSKSLVDFITVDNMNVYECHYKLAHCFTDAGTIFVVLSQKADVIESSIFTSLTQADSGPVIIWQEMANAKAGELTKAIENRFQSCLKLLNTEMNFEEQQLFSNVKKAHYLFSQPNFITRATFEELKSFKNRIYDVARKQVDDRFPEQTILKGLDLSELATKFKSEKTGEFSSLDMIAKLWCLSVQGEIILKQIGHKFLYCDRDLFIQCINELSKLKNKDSEGRLIPWLPDDSNAYYLAQEKLLFEKLKLSESQIDLLREFLYCDHVAIKVLEPWMNECCSHPCAFLTSQLPQLPPVKLESFWPLYCDNYERELESLFTLTFQPTSLLVSKIFYYSARFGKIVMIWSNGVVLHYGCTEICIKLTTQSDLPLLNLCVRTLKVNATNSTDDRELANSDENLHAVLISTFQLFRQFIVTSLIQLNLFGIESMKCPNCASKKTFHELHLWAHNSLQCGELRFSSSELGIGDYYPNNICKHGPLKACVITPRKTCVMCNERFENYSDEFWCGSENSCYTCTSCLKLLGNQNSVLNIRNSYDLYFPKNQYEKSGCLYEMQTNPLVIEFKVYREKFFDIVIQPLNIVGQCMLTVDDQDRFDLKEICPNYDKIILSRYYDEDGDDDNVCYKMAVPNVDFHKIFCSSREITFRILLAEKSTKIMILSDGSLDLRVYTITAGMHLEANRRVDCPDEIGLASIREIDDRGWLFITFDTLDGKSDYWTAITDDNLHPCGYCNNVKQNLRVKENNESDDSTNNKIDYWPFEESTNNWIRYFDVTQTFPVPFQFFSTRTTATFDFRLPAQVPSYFKEGMKLETFDRRFPQRRQNVIATIKQINQDENSIVLSYDVYDDVNGGKTEFVYALDDKLIHPIGYSAILHNYLAASPAFENNLEYRYEVTQSFLWLVYLRANPSVIPAPYECFTEEQIGACPKHVAYSFFRPSDPPTVNDKRCNDSLTMHKFNTYSSYHLLNVRDMNAVGGFASHEGYGFVPLPIELNSDEYFIYPRRNLIHKFGNVDKQLLHTMVYRTPFKRVSETDDPERVLSTLSFVGIVPSNMKLLSDFLPSYEESKSFYHFFVDYYYEMTYYLTLLTRYKLNINVDEIKILFPFVTSINERQLAEGIHRYCSLIMASLMTMFSSKNKPAYEVDGCMLKVVSDNLLQVLSSSVSSDSLSKMKMRSIDIGSTYAKTILEFYTYPYNHIVLSIENETNLSQISPLLPLLSNFRSLTEIILNRSNLDKFEIDTTFLSSSLETLSLDENPLNRIPDCVFSLYELRTLSLNGCGIKNIPDNFGTLKKLSKLNLGANSITAIPSSLSKLKLFCELNLEAVPLFRTDNILPFHEIIFFAQRKNVSVFQNKSDDEIKAILAEKVGLPTKDTVMIEQPIQVEKLNAFIVDVCQRLEYKKTDGFPTELLSLKRLEVLDLSHQHITTIPTGIKHLNRLKTLTLNGCRYLQEISEQIAAIKNFKSINLVDCSALTNPPPEIVRRGVEATIGFLRRSLAGAVECRRTKLMMVGLGGAGKTKFVQALISNDLRTSQLDAPPVTDGIDISTLTKAVDNGTSIDYSIWDFAGQSVYYNTHQFFLSNRAIYFLLWNSRLGYENSGLDFWLSSIACHAPKAPIFIIATHADQIDHIELPITELQTTYPKIVHFAHISSITGFGMNELMNKIVEITLVQPYINLKVPTIFLNLEATIAQESSATKDSTENVERFIMPFDKVCDLSKPLGLITPLEVKEALNFLHELGSLQYFTNNILKDFVILKPQWLVDAMACLISVKANILQDGRFRRNEVSTIWAKYPKNLHQWLLCLTEEFDLSFPLKDDDVNVVPCMLPDVEPQIVWGEADNKNVFETKMFYKFQYLPTGLFNRAQSRLCQYYEGSKIWKKGSLLMKNEHVALIRQTKEKELTVTVQGARPANVLFLIHEVIENLIHDFFQGVNYDLSFPCPDCMKSVSPEPYMFSRKKVKRATELKVPFLQCSNFFHVVSLHTLHSLMPPTSIADYEQHMIRMVQDMNDLQAAVMTDICILCSSSNVKQANQASPVKLSERLRSNNISSTVISLKEDGDISVDFGLKISQASLLIICISSEFCNSKKCSDTFAYVRQGHKPTLYAVIGNTEHWKSTSIGLQIKNEFYFDFQKLDNFEVKFAELVDNIKVKTSKKTKHVRRSPVFFSYCWTNSMECVKNGHKKVDSALGEMDPRLLAKDLINQDIDLWIDYKNVGQGGIFEDIADAIKHADIFVACVSDEYVTSQNCLREFRFASTIELTKLICVVGKGNNWQKSEVNFLALGSTVYNFQIRNKDEVSNLLKKIQTILKEKRSVVNSIDENKMKKKTETINLSAYKELGELAQRKLLQQASLIATRLRSNDLTMSKPYPRIFFIDLSSSSLDKVGTQSIDQGKTSKVEGRPSTTPSRPRTAGRSKTASGVGLWDNVDMSHLCFKWLCEHEGGWHVTGKTIFLTAVEDLYVATLTDFLDKIAPFESQILNLLQHSSVPVNLLAHTNGEEMLKDLKLRANTVGIDSFEASYRFMCRLIRQLDVGASRGGMQRCYLYSKKIVWLCPEHQKFSRGFLADDDLDSEDVTINMDESVDYPPSKMQKDNNLSVSNVREDLPSSYSATSADSEKLPSEDSENFVINFENLQRTRSKACVVM